MDGRSSLAAAALSVALREHRDSALADAEARVRAAERRVGRVGEVVEDLVRETVGFIEWLEGEGIVSSSTTNSVLRRVHRELRRITERPARIANGQTRP